MTTKNEAEKEFGEMPAELKAKLNIGSYDALLREPEIATALQMLYNPGEENEIYKLIMRTDMPDLGFLLGIAHFISRCEKHNKVGLKKIAYLILAGYPAVHKDKPFINRTEQVIRAIIGELEQKKHAHSGGQGFVETFKQKAGFSGGDGA